MRFARVLHPPVHGARPGRVDDEAARAMPGVTVVRDDRLIAVVAERDQLALAALRTLDVEWDPPPGQPMAPVAFDLRKDEGVDGALQGAAQRLSVRYYAPHIASAPIGPSAAVADVRDEGVEIYAATQRPFGLRDEAAQILGLAPERIRVHPQMASGTYGRNNIQDAPIEAVRVSRAVRAPVMVQWTRADELRLSPNRPELTAEISAGLDASGTIVAWRYHERTNPHTYAGAWTARFAEMTGGRNAVPPYRVGRADIHLVIEGGVLRTGAYRSLAGAPNVFAIESTMDELAALAGVDPIAFRLRHIDDPRLRRVLETVRDRSGWPGSRAGGATDEVRGLGVASTIYHGTYVAQVAEVLVAPSGRVRLERVVCAIDPGRIVHPDGVRNQVEGGVQQTASWTLFEELSHDGGEVTATSWADYPIATFRDAPKAIDVILVPQVDAPSSGVGEPGAVPTAAAIANAVYAATGVRVRDLPLRPDRVRKAAAG
jgi:CO/xanthine dehydrogenase Mo-binding subunit